MFSSACGIPNTGLCYRSSSLRYCRAAVGIIIQILLWYQAFVCNKEVHEAKLCALRHDGQLIEVQTRWCFSPEKDSGAWKSLFIIVMNLD